MLSTLRIADLRRFVYAVADEKRLAVPRYKTKIELAKWLLEFGPRLLDAKNEEQS